MADGLHEAQRALQAASLRPAPSPNSKIVLVLSNRHIFCEADFLTMVNNNNIHQVGALCNGDYDRDLKFEVFDWEMTGTNLAIILLNRVL